MVDGYDPILHIYPTVFPMAKPSMVFQNFVGLKTQRQRRFQILDPRQSWLLTCEFFVQSCKWFLPPKLPFTNNWEVFPKKWQQHLFSHYNYLSANFFSQPSRFVVFKLPDTWRWQQQRTRNSVLFVPQSWNVYRPRNGCSPWRIQSDESNKTLVATRGNT